MTGRRYLTLLLLLLSYAPLLLADSQLRQKNWVEDMQQRSSSEDQITLNASSGDKEEKFFALFRPEELGRPSGAVIMLHDIEGHPDWPESFHQLRTELPRYGWSTLALTLPPLDRSPGSKINYQPLLESGTIRLEAAKAYLLEKKIYNVVILGHGLGATVATYYLQNHFDDLFHGVIVLGMDGNFSAEGFDAASALTAIRIPIFDLYGSDDLFSVMSSSKRRRTMAVKTDGNTRTHTQSSDYAFDYSDDIAKKITYRQFMFPATDHNFSQMEQPLLQRVVGWLRRYAPGSEIRVDENTLTR
ncbi:MAG: DUF3530 family protein [Gammaproteobacteria bacterium]|nr:DUF3530 family protein [Gammaproteobacteria bacterium]